MNSCSIFIFTVLGCFVIIGIVFAVRVAVGKRKPPAPKPAILGGDDPFRPYRTDLASPPPPPPPQFRAELKVSIGGHASRPPRLPGPSWLSAPDYGFKVTGTSHYQGALEAICGGRTDESVERQEVAQLIPENSPYDANAVRVEIQGREVGHLPRDDAKAFRDRIARERLTGPFSCPALIVGGWEGGNFGVRLALALYG